MNGNRKRCKKTAGKQRIEEMCCGSCFAKRNAAAVAAVGGGGGGGGGGSRKIADKGMRIRARMENAEKDIVESVERKCK